MDVTRTVLPGIGVRYEFVTTAGDQLGIVFRRDGRREIVVYDRDDPDTSRALLRLTGDESDALSELLGAPRIVERLADMHRDMEGIVSTQVGVPPGSAFDGRTLGDTQARTRTGASVVAVLRDRQLLPSPRPDFRFAGGDVIVVVGTPEGTAAVARLLEAPA